ncbi:SDR family NAD(P)-dependent oxidoreductase [Actinomadura roseirufa]|uniref:SDR family NAD(P)-dependent oxidoreductase n=1 Tax=Actinomadura roseirufa TaxID=2094049 RepID=UPI0010417059|nr:SDR family NAD(P)-dependent oxidoreductase [Actinomadura roseirufa]
MRIAKDRKAFITGGGSGFGRHIARRLHAAGACVTVVDLDADGAVAVADELGHRALAVTADVRSTADMVHAVGMAENTFGGLDTLVVSAGVFHIGALETVTEREWDRTLDVSLKGAFITVQAAAAALRASGRGRIVTMGSDCGRRGFPQQAPYTAAKFGLIGLTESVAAELAPDQVTANCVCPVGVPTTGMGQEVLNWKVQRTGRSPEEVMSATARTNPLGRNADEDDVADAVLFFLSDHAGFLTGVTLDVDGGARLGTVPGVR